MFRRLAVLAAIIATCLIVFRGRASVAVEDQECKESLKDEFFKLGMQYYVTGRFAASPGVGLAPVSGNLLHHALEMFLKGGLCASLSENERRGLHHNLKRIWKKFKRTIGDKSLKKFDDVISEVHKYETIRYPENIVSWGMLATVQWAREQTSFNARSEPRYNLVIEDVDAVVDVIFDKCSRNPAAYAIRTEPASTYLRHGNKTRFGFVQG